jgi:hypothetical protein
VSKDDDGADDGDETDEETGHVQHLDTEYDFLDCLHHYIITKMISDYSLQYITLLFTTI